MRVSLPEPRACTECGSDPIHHGKEYWSLVESIVMRPLLTLTARMGETITRRSRIPRVKKSGLSETLARLNLGELRDAPDDKTPLLDHVLWAEAEARGITMREFRILGLPTASFIARLPDGRRFAFESIPLPVRAKPGVWWLDNKPVMKKRFREMGIPTARGGAAYTLKGAIKIFRDLDTVAIVKPHEGSGSRHTTMHVADEAALKRAFAVSNQVSPKVIVEEELIGSVYRPTLVDGRLIATLKRDTPRVIGDGMHTIAELIEIENGHPARKGPYFSKIKYSAQMEAELARQEATLESIPEKGREIKLHPKINWAVGGTTTDVTDIVHPENKKLFEEIAPRAQSAHSRHRFYY